MKSDELREEILERKKAIESDEICYNHEMEVWDIENEDDIACFGELQTHEVEWRNFYNKYKYKVYETEDPELITFFAKIARLLDDNSDKFLKECKIKISKFQNPKVSYYYAKNVTNYNIVDIIELGKVAIDEKNPYYCYKFAKLLSECTHPQGMELGNMIFAIESFRKVVLESKNIDLVCQLAKDVKGINICSLERDICKIYGPKEWYTFVTKVPYAIIEIFEEALRERENKYYLRKFECIRIRSIINDIENQAAMLDYDSYYALLTLGRSNEDGVPTDSECEEYTENQRKNIFETYKDKVIKLRDLKLLEWFKKYGEKHNKEHSNDEILKQYERIIEVLKVVRENLTSGTSKVGIYKKRLLEKTKNDAANSNN